jgi:hypothetical protein
MTAAPRGLFDLQAPLDLLEKMEFHDRQLPADPMDVYAAFDFVVGAAHLPEWLNHFRCSAGRGDARAEALKDLCGHLGNGAKHFVAKRHDAVERHAVSPPAIAGLARSGITFVGGTHQKADCRVASR